MPAWNEAENIKQMIDTLFEKEFPKISAEMHLLVVDNNSSDGMTEIVEHAASNKKNLHIVQQGTKKGLGNAYVIGMKYAIKTLNADAILEMDADGQHPPEFVKPMVDAYLNGADYAIGARYIKGGSVPKEWAFSRRAISYLGNLFIRLVLVKPRLHDLTTGFRLSRVKGVLDKIDLDNLMELERFAYKVDLLYQCVKNSKKTVEVPLQFRPRVTDKSKFNPKEMISTFKVAIILGINDKKKFIKFGTVGFIGYLVNAIGLQIMTNIDAPGVLAWSIPVELAIISNFVLNNVWTFKADKITGFGKTVIKFLEFNLTSAGALIIQTLAGLAVDAIFGIGSSPIFGISYRQLSLPFIIGMLVLPYNYFMYNVVIWKSWNLKKKA